MSRTTFKSDKFKKNRGGYSRWLMLHCEKCKHELFAYQKDGPGILKRLYLDRISLKMNAARNLVCSGCKSILGIPIVYEKEKRPAFRLFAGAVGKKIVKVGSVK